MGVCIDRTCSPARMYGMTELQLNRYTIHESFQFKSIHFYCTLLPFSPKDVWRTFRALASRNTAGTTMNDSSSRDMNSVNLAYTSYKMIQYKNTVY